MVKFCLIPNIEEDKDHTTQLALSNVVKYLGVDTFINNILHKN